MKISKEMRNAFEALVPGLGAIERSDWEQGIYLHTYPELARTFDRGEHNRGYTLNPWRGDHVSIPAWDENSGLAVLEISFHKGQTFIEVVRFAGGPATEAAVRLLGWTN